MSDADSKTEGRVLSTEECHEFVVSRTKAAWDVMIAGIDEVHTGQRWKLLARICNGFFALVYQPMIEFHVHNAFDSEPPQPEPREGE